jgi:Flp pilus assembly protein TadB
MTTAFDNQSGDFVWAIVTALRADYNLRQVIEVLSSDAPEPTAAACRLFLTEWDRGPDEITSLNRWEKAISSDAAGRLAEALRRHLHEGSNLIELLDPLSEEFLLDYGSDPAFHDCMRREAEMLGAKIPERIEKLSP